MPSTAFATCLSDDAALMRVPSRGSKDQSAISKKLQLNWYPTSSAPTADNQVIPYVYGACAFADIAIALATAFAPEHRIYLLGWSTDKGMELPPGSGITLEDYLSSTRAQVRAMFWNGKLPLGLDTNVHNEWVNKAINGLPHGASILDGRLPALGRLPPLGIHHTKLVVIQGAFGAFAFMGGMDFQPSRTVVQPDAGWPWHDTQIRLAGAAALACRKLFEDRWLDHPETIALDRKLGVSGADRAAIAFPSPTRLSPGDLPSVTMAENSPRSQFRLRVAIGRTCAKNTYGFAPRGDYGAWALVEAGIKQARRWIYVEDQYLVSRMARKMLLDKLRETSFEHILILIANSGAVTDFPFLVTARNEFRHDLMAIDPQKKRWGMYTLAKPSDPERQKWCGSFVHSKTWVFDDGYAIIGSANCDNRGYTLDSELVAGIADTDETTVRRGASFATNLRTTLWHKHLGVPHAELRDWEKGIKHWKNPPPSAMIADASALEVDPSFQKPQHLISQGLVSQPVVTAVVERVWTTVLDPDAR